MTKHPEVDILDDDENGKSDHIRRHVALTELVSCWLCPKGKTKCFTPPFVLPPPHHPHPPPRTGHLRHPPLQHLHTLPNGNGGSPPPPPPHPYSQSLPTHFHPRQGGLGGGLGGFEAEDMVAMESVATCKHLPLGSRATGLTLEFCQRGSRLTWKTREVVLRHSNPDVVLAWHAALWTLLLGLKHRPTRVLVLINPVGGRRKARSIYRKKVAPLFRRAAIATSVAQTEYQGHGTDILLRTSLERVDGVVVVGGDGLVNEAVTGLLLKEARVQGLDVNDTETPLPVTPLRIGIIPGGSTDATCHASHGTSDVVTAALHIIMGDERFVDVATVHCQGRLARVATSLISYGYFGDLLRTSERWRHLGPPRYLLSGVKQFFLNRSYEGSVFVKPPPFLLSTPTDTDVCSDQCRVCDKARLEDTTSPTALSASSRTSSEDTTYQELRGRWHAVSAAVSSCACRLTPHGVSPAAHLGDGCADIVLIPAGSRLRFLHYLYRTSVTGNALSLNHLQVRRVREMVFMPAEERPTSLWNCDGEQLMEPALKLRVHCQRLRLFSRGVEQTSNNDNKTSSKAL
ncbi:ceramide kinase [Oratosquilla oratoria]|uniref:ceramide kinase n=1 Tax=Oratosquilla oratoria TaxID=337810 RepID=UPI003F7596E2